MQTRQSQAQQNRQAERQWAQSPPSPAHALSCTALQGQAGELTEHAGRLCVAVPVSSDGPPKGILLGTTAGGGAWWVECHPAALQFPVPVHDGICLLSVSPRQSHRGHACLL